MNSVPFPSQPAIQPNITPEELQLIQELRERNPAQQRVRRPLTFGERLSDRVAAVVGSWNFVLIQSVSLIIWIILNAFGVVTPWDPYPFILLNLMLSFQAAYTAPIIMMSQNRQAQIDRQDAKHDYDVNLKAELEIELLHDKINMLREAEMMEVLQLLRAQQEPLELLNLLRVQQEQIGQLEQKLDQLLHQAQEN